MNDKVIAWCHIGLRKTDIQAKGADMRDLNPPKVKLTSVLKQIMEKITLDGMHRGTPSVDIDKYPAP